MMIHHKHMSKLNSDDETHRTEYAQCNFLLYHPVENVADKTYSLSYGCIIAMLDGDGLSRGSQSLE